MQTQIYERPVIVRNPVGLMNKIGRRGDVRSQREIDGVPIQELCQSFGSPLFVFSERRLRSRIAEERAAFAKYPGTRLCWSYKTNYLSALCAICHQEGSLAEVVSGMEYEKARALGVPGSSIVFNGPSKTRNELELAAAEGAILHADHLEEIELIERIAIETHTTPQIGIRVGLDAGIYPRWDRFGFDLESGLAKEAVRRILRSGRLKFGGLHSHIGTFVLDAAAYGRAARKVLEFASVLEGELGVRPTHLDMGGGFASNNTLGGQYHSGALVPPIGEYAEEIVTALTEHKGPRYPLLVETGRALVDDAGTLITSVLASKRLSTGKRAIVVDAGVNLLFTAWWYRLGISPTRAVDSFLEDTAVYGPLCMNIDCVRESIPLPELRAGDALSIHPAGAYTFTQSMQFIKLRPACVLINRSGDVELIRRAEELDDLTRPELLPDRLRGPYSEIQ
ncbi:MAG TPA: alanine racemase [Polyangiaceae bacterium]|nr:alanine racemase [Polyangiaceae bacterium]